MSVTISARESGDVAVLELSGKLTLGDATGALREAVRNLVSKGYKNLVLNLTSLEYMDSAGLGELVGAFTTVRNAGGEMKLVAVTGRALDLLQVTRLTTLFEFFEQEAAAVISFS